MDSWRRRKLWWWRALLWISKETHVTMSVLGFFAFHSPSTFSLTGRWERGMGRVIQALLVSDWWTDAGRLLQPWFFRDLGDSVGKKNKGYNTWLVYSPNPSFDGVKKLRETNMVTLPSKRRHLSWTSFSKNSYNGMRPPRTNQLEYISPKSRGIASRLT